MNSTNKTTQRTVCVSCFNVNWGLFATFSLQPGVFWWSNYRGCYCLWPMLLQLERNRGRGWGWGGLKSNETAPLLKSDVICILHSAKRKLSAKCAAGGRRNLDLDPFFFSFFSHSSSVWNMRPWTISAKSFPPTGLPVLPALLRFSLSAELNPLLTPWRETDVLVSLSCRSHHWVHLSPLTRARIGLSEDFFFFLVGGFFFFPLAQNKKKVAWGLQKHPKRVFLGNQRKHHLHPAAGLSGMRVSAGQN